MHHTDPIPAARWAPVRAGFRVLLGLLLGLTLAGTSMVAADAAQPDARGDAVVAAARTHLGQTYTWGGAGPDTWDCSGLTSVLWRSVGGADSIPRIAKDQQDWAVPIPREQALPGDLVFFGAPVTHVGIVSMLGAAPDSSLTMLDASSSRGGVVERQVWTTDVIRFGRVPRPAMPVVLPWTPPPPPIDVPTGPAPVSAPVSAPVLGPSPAPVSTRSTAPVITPSPAPVSARRPVVRRPSTSPLDPLVGLPKGQRGVSSVVAARAAHLASTVAGATTFTDVSLVRTAWRAAGGGVLPADRGHLVGLARQVALRDAQVGDLVVYGAPAVHLGIYVGAGLMVDASRVLGRVVVRPVYGSRTVALLRLPG